MTEQDNGWWYRVELSAGTVSVTVHAASHDHAISVAQSMLKQKLDAQLALGTYDVTETSDPDGD